MVDPTLAGPHRPALRAAAVALCAAVALAACATTREVRVSAPVLPAGLAAPAGAAGVHFTPAARTAIHVAPLALPYDLSTTLQADLGAALVQTVRAALAQRYVTVLDVSDPEATPAGLPLLVVGAVALSQAAAPPDAVVWRLWTRVAVDYEWRAAGVADRRWQGTGAAGLGVHGSVLMADADLLAWTLRNAAAQLLLALPDGAAAAAPPVAQAAPTARGVVVLRLDAGLPRDGGLERRIADCLAPVQPAPAALAGPQPAASLRDLTFPYLEPGVTPQGPGELRQLLLRPSMQARLAAAGVTHLITFTARDADVHRTDALLCGGSGCLGYASRVEGYVVDMVLWQAAGARLLAARSATHTTTLGVVGVLVPLPFVVTNAREVCAQLQDAVAAALAASLTGDPS